MACIEAHDLTRRFGQTLALDHIDVTVEDGSIVGLIGPNGAGKSTLLSALLGLAPHDGTLIVCGRDPWRERAALMRDVSFIADVATLPGWMRACQLLDYMAGVHPRFDRAKAERLLARTTIQPGARIRTLSKGMIVQLHLAVVLAIDARLMVLDEPTLGLDPSYRKAFYETVLGDYYDRDRTILIVTHELDEIESILTHVVMLDRGRLRLAASMEAIAARFTELTPRPECLAAARALLPISERKAFGQMILLFDGIDRKALGGLGELRTPRLSELFAALTGQQPGAFRKAAA